MIKINKLKIIIPLAILIPFLTAVPIFAAEITIDSGSQKIGVGEQFEARVFIDADDEDINAVEGKILFPAGLLEVRDIQDGNSIINFWIEKPKNTLEGQIVFSGIIPAGYRETKGSLFSVVFQAKSSGSGAIEIGDAKVLLNDGRGTPAEVKISNFQLTIKEDGIYNKAQLLEIKDTAPPEDFKPEIASNPLIFDGKYFLVFATQDKMSGIANYKVREGGWAWFRVAESPYLLEHQSLDRKIFVKAIDKSGNERIVAVEPRYRLSWYEPWQIWTIIISGAIIICLILKKIWKK